MTDPLRTLDDVALDVAKQIVAITRIPEEERIGLVSCFPIQDPDQPIRYWTVWVSHPWYSDTQPSGLGSSDPTATVGPDPDLSGGR